MNNTRRILIERYVSQRCILLQEAAKNYAAMDDVSLLDAYNQAQKNYYEMYNLQNYFGQQMVNNAQTFIDNNIDITRNFGKWEDYNVVLDNEKDLEKARKLRPDMNYQEGDIYKSKKRKPVFLPHIGQDMDRDTFSKLMHALKNKSSFTYKGTTFAHDKVAQLFLGPSNTWGYDEIDGKFRMSTTDNTCAAFVCSVMDVTDADMNQRQENSQIQFNNFLDDYKKKWSKNFTPEKWNELLTSLAVSDEDYNDGKRTYLNTRTYAASPYKIQKAASKNKDTWTTIDQDDFQRDIPKDQRLDVRSDEYWNKYIKPGDLIVYYNKEGQTHIAIAGNSPNEIFHDGSDVNNVRDNSINRAHERRGLSKPNESFRIIRYTNHEQLDIANNELLEIEAALKNRNLDGADVYAQNDDGSYSIQQQQIQIDPIGIQDDGSISASKDDNKVDDTQITQLDIKPAEADPLTPIVTNIGPTKGKGALSRVWQKWKKKRNKKKKNKKGNNLASSGNKNIEKNLA